MTWFLLVKNNAFNYNSKLYLFGDFRGILELAKIAWSAKCVNIAWTALKAKL